MFNRLAKGSFIFLDSCGIFLNKIVHYLSKMICWDINNFERTFWTLFFWTLCKVNILFKNVTLWNSMLFYLHRQRMWNTCVQTNILCKFFKIYFLYLDILYIIYVFFGNMSRMLMLKIKLNLILILIYQPFSCQELAI